MNAAASKSMSVAPGVLTQERVEGGVLNPGLETVWTVLRLTFGLVPIIAGLDKFTNLLVNWEQYLNPAILQLIPVSGRMFMGIVGVIEMSAGILVLARPREGGYVVMAWLICIALSLITSGRFLDVAVRDLVMAIGAFTLASLTPMVRRDTGSPARE